MPPLVLSWKVRAGVLYILDCSKAVYLPLWPCERFHWASRRLHILSSSSLLVLLPIGKALEVITCSSLSGETWTCSLVEAEEKRSAWVDHVGRLLSRISLLVGYVCHRGSCFGVDGLKYCLEQQENKWQVHISHCFSSPICTSIVDLARHQLQTWHWEEQTELIYLISALKTPGSISLLSSWKGLWHSSYCWIHCSY